MKFKFTTPARGSFYDRRGLDYINPDLGTVSKQAWKSGTRFSGTNSVLRMTELNRARDLGALSPEELARKYNPGALDPQLGSIYSDPEREAYAAAESVPTLDEFKKLGFNEPLIKLTADEANDRYGLGGHLQFQDGVSNLEAFILHKRKVEEIKFNYVLQQAEGGRYAAGLGIELAAGLLDPVAFAVGGYTPPALSARLMSKLGTTSKLGQRFIKGGTEGFVGSLAVEPLIAGAAYQEQAEYGAAQSLMNVTFGTVFGGGLHVVGGKISDTIKNRTKERHIASIKTAINQAAEGENVEVRPIIEGGNQTPDAEQIATVKGFEPDSPEEVGAKFTESTKKADSDNTVEKHFPNSNVDESLNLINSKQGGGALLNLSFSKIFDKGQKLVADFSRVATLKKTNKNLKQRLAYRITDTNGKVILVQPRKKGAALKLFETEQFAPPEGMSMGDYVHQGLLVHGIDSTGSSTSYRGTYQFDENNVYHVINIDGVTFDPKMNQHRVSILSPDKAFELFSDGPLGQVFSEHAPKIEKIVSDLNRPKVAGPNDDLVTMSGVDEALDASKLTQVGGQEGSNPGGLHVDQVTGQKYYVKYPKTEDLAINEFIAATLYRVLGVDFPVSRLVVKDGKVVGIASEILEGIKPLTLDELFALPPLIKQRFVEDMVVDMFLGNWDVIGNPPNLNVFLKPNGTIGRLDPGGALMYRAQGEPKQLSDTFEEIKTFLDPNINPHTAKLISEVLGVKGLTAKTQGPGMLLKLSQEKVTNILSLSPADVSKLADISGFKDTDKLTATLLNRQSDLGQKVQSYFNVKLKFKKKSNPLLFHSKKDAGIYLDRKAAAFHSNLTPKQKNVFSTWLANGHKKINDYLYGKSTGKIDSSLDVEHLEDMIAVLDSILVPTKNPLLSHRGGTPYWGIKANGVQMSNPKDINAAKAMVGGIFKLEGYASTTLNKSFADAWQHNVAAKESILMQVQVNPGVKVAYVKSSSGEYELLLQRGLEYQIKNATELPNGRILLNVEALDPNAPKPVKVTPKLGIDIAKAHKQDSSNAVNDSLDRLPFESDDAVQTTLKPDAAERQTAELQKNVDEILEDVKSELVNMDETLLAAFSKEIDEINKMGSDDIVQANNLYKAAKAAARCVMGAG